MLTLLAFAGITQAANVEAETYTYGSHPDIAKVLRLDEPATFECKVVSATMTYLDSQGQKHAMRYEKLSSACTNQG